MDTKRFNLDAALTLIAAYLGLIVGLVDANAINLALPAIRDSLGGGISGAQWTGPQLPMTAGLTLMAAGMALYAAAGPQADVWLLELAFVLAGAGLALNTGRYDPHRDARDALSSAGHEIRYELTDRGRDFLAEIGVELPTRRRPLVRYCVDWTEQRHHLSGGLGRGVLDRFVSAEWVKRVPRGRALTVTDAGRIALAGSFGIEWAA
jgi:hypothetical protein